MRRVIGYLLEYEPARPVLEDLGPARASASNVSIRERDQLRDAAWAEPQTEPIKTTAELTTAHRPRQEANE
jgi:hypothetical protein